MYFSNAAVDGVAERLPEIFNCLKSDRETFSKKTKLDDTLESEPFPVEPVLWPVDSRNCTISSHRGNGAIAIVHGGADGLIIKLNTGVNYESFMERGYMQSSVMASPQSGTVLGDLRARSLWPNIADDVTAPMIGKGTDADLLKFVKEGKHIEGVAARLLALGLEHALSPFTQRTRIRNAAACYWCTGKYKSDAITFSIQNAQTLLQWATPGGVREDHDPTSVIWVGNADKTRGMSILSRIMDAGGPMMLQESYLCKNFDAGRLLMVGTGALARELAPIQPNDLQHAIDEAIWLLVTYNNLSLTFIRNTLRLLIRNLPIVDTCHYAESDPRYWRVRSGLLGDPDLNVAITDIVDAQIAESFTDDALTAVGLDVADHARGVLSDLFRRDAFAPGAGLQGLAPSTTHLVRWEVLGMLAALQQATAGDVGGISVHFGVLDTANPPAVPNVAAIERGHMDAVMGTFSGRNGFHLYAYSNPIPDPLLPVFPDGWQLIAGPQPVDIQLPNGVANDGQWIEWVGGYNNVGLPYIVAAGLRAYAVRQWVPSTADHYTTSYLPPPSVLRRFDVPENYKMGVRMNGAWPDISTVAPRCAIYVNENNGADDPLGYLVEDGQRGVMHLTNGQKSLALMISIAYLWDAHHLGATQNDAYRRWIAANHNNRHLTTVPDELLLYLGGARSRRYVDPNGGLWTLCYTTVVPKINARGGHEATLTILKDTDRLASYIMKFRSAIEMCDQLLRVSNARISGCASPFLWPAEVDARLARARVYDTTVIDNATYLARQALMMAAVFDHPDASVARTFNTTACSTLRVREITQLAGWGIGAVKHINWMSPQQLKYPTWANFYGVAAPTFVLDRYGRSLLDEAHFTTTWQGVKDDFEAGAMIHRSDEIWSAILTSFVYTDWYPASLEIMNFGTSLLIDVSDVRTRHDSNYTQPLMRLNLPYETQMAIATVIGADHDEQIRPELPCADVAQVAQGDVILNTIITYDARGKITATALNPLAIGFENLDLRDTAFCSGGVTFAATSATALIGEFGDLERMSGQFWMSTQKQVSAVVAGMSAGAQRLLDLLSPPPPIITEDDGLGKEVRAAARIDNDAPDVHMLAPIGTPGVGNVPLAEINTSSAESILSSLSNASPEVMALIRNALLKGKLDDDGRTNSTADSTKDSNEPT